MSVQIQLRRDSAADWTSVDPTLAEGEFGYETDTGDIKIGDGATAWTLLSYFAPGGGSGTVTSINLTAPAAGITVSGGPITSSGSITLALADDLAALEALSGTNTIYYRSAASTWTAVTIGGLLSFSAGTLNVGDAELAAIAGLTSAADALPYFTGSGTAAVTTLTAAARTVLDDTTVAAMVDTLGGAASTGTGGIARATSPTFVTPILGTPTSGTLTNCTLPVGGITGLGTGVATALAAAVDGTGGLASKAYADALVVGLLDFKGSTDCSANPNYPAALKGDAYYVSVAGKIGGASGKTVEVGDVYVASADNAGGTEASAGTSWFVLEHNLVGAVISGGALGTPSSGTLTNCTGLPISTGVSGLAAGVATFLATPSSANLISAVTDETGTGALVFANTPTLVTPLLGTPTSGTLTNCTGLPVSTGVSGFGTGVATALAVNVGSAGAFVTFNGAGGTPSSLTLTNATGLPVAGGGTGATTAQAARTNLNLRTVTADSDGATITFDINASPFHNVTLGGNRTLALSNDADGDRFVLVLKQDGTGSRTVTWFSGIKWPAGTVPTLTTTAGKYDVFSFVRVASGEYLNLGKQQNL